MTTRAYRFIGNLSFALAIAAVLTFDSFRSPLIPGLVLVGAGALAMAIHTLARFQPLKPDSLEAADGQSVCITTTAEHPQIITSEEAKPRNRRQIQAIETLLEEAAAEAEAMAIQRDELVPGRQYVFRYVRRSQFYARQLQQAQQGCPDWRAVHTAIQVAKTLNPQPTEYEVILTRDGTLKISPKSRVTQDDPQLEEPVRPPRNVGESTLIN
jgi:hypothetical protein